MRSLAILVCFCLQACLIGKDSGSGPCGDGEHQFTRFHVYDARDSLSAIFAVEADGDTVSKDFFEYDGNGSLVRHIWIHTLWSPAEDTSCWGYERVDSGKAIRSYACDDRTLTESMQYLDSSGRPGRAIFYLRDSAVAGEQKYQYDQSDRLTAVIEVHGDEEFVKATNAFDEDGSWKGSVVYDSLGQIVTRTVVTDEGPGRIRAETFDSQGGLIGWELSRMNADDRIERSISCKP